MNRYQFLQGVHDNLEPRSYLEIGINDGRSLALSRTRTIGIDPAFKIVVDLACDLQLIQITSDEFFDRPDPIEWIPSRKLDLTFVDGMHLFEFALRDFMNAERLSDPTGVIVLDDVLPRAVQEAARVRHTLGWTGDVYKVALVLEQYRPDLTVVAVDTKPTGTLLVAGLDPTSTTLTDNYEKILAEQIHDDPQDVPSDLMHRRHAAHPRQLLGAGIWADLKAARTDARGPSVAAIEQLAGLRGSADFVLKPRDWAPWPPVSDAKKQPPKPSTAKRIVRKARRTLGSGGR